MRVTNATGGTFTLTFNGQTTAPLAYNATAAQVDAALEALSNVGANNIQTSGGPVQHGQRQRVLPARAAAVRPEPDHRRRRGPDGHRADGRHDHGQQGGWYQRLTGDSAPQRAEHQRPARQGAALQGQGRRHHRRRRQQGRLRHGHRRVHDPGREPVPARRGRAAGQDAAGGLRDGLPQPVPHPGRRERRRVHQRLLAGRADAQQRSRGPSGTGRFEIVRKPSNYGWPTCYKRDLAVLPVELPRVRAQHHHGRHAAATARRELHDVRRRRRSATTRCGTSRAARRSSPASSRCRRSPTRTSGTRTATTTPRRRSARRAWAYYAPTPGPIAPGSTTECPRLFPELYTGRRRPARHDEVQLRPGQPEPEEVPAVLRRLGDLRRVDAGHAARGQARRSEPRSSRSTASSTAAAGRTPRPARSCSSATTRWTCSAAPTARSTC